MNNKEDASNLKLESDKHPDLTDKNGLNSYAKKSVIIHGLLKSHVNDLFMPPEI